MKNAFIFAIGSFVLLLFLGQSTFSQISQGGTPPSFIERTISQDIEVRSFPAPDVEALLAEDEENIQGAKPLRAGKILPANIEISNAGTWTDLPDQGKIWRIKLKSEGAHALGVYFNWFYLPDGGELYLYSQSKDFVIGAFTNFNNDESGSFATELIPGDEVILEYYSPDGQMDNVGLSIEGISYIYQDKGLPWNSNNRSDWCMINVNCEEGDDWQKEKQGVVRLKMRADGWDWWCSGSMINNTEWDRTPYVLTASHCGYDAESYEYNQWVFYFNYEASSCNGNYGPSNQTMTGAYLRAYDYFVDGENVDGSDFRLVELKTAVPTSYDPYFNGWDRRDIPGDSGVSIHHPDADIKKISTYQTMVSSSWWTGLPSHWQLWWIETVNGKSIVEGGSSGSPVFNEHKNIIGDLTGGYASSSCDNPSPSWYGKLYWSWDKNGNTPEDRLKDWLDPNNKGWEYCNGVSWVDSPPIVDFSTDTTIVNMGDSVQFYDMSENYPNEWEWTIEGTDSLNYYVENPKVVFADSGWYNVELVASNPDGTGDLLIEDFIYVNFVELPVADFTSDTTMLAPFETVDFFDMSAGDPFEWEWSFEGGTPNSSTNQNPEGIKYFASGLYDVSLTATNGGGSNTMLKEDYINVVWVGIDENEEVQNIKLFPNPTNGKFTLEFLNLEYRIAEVQVFDLGGNLVDVLKSKNSNTTLSIDIEDQPEGIYYLNIKVDDKIYIDKVSLVK